MEIIECNGVRAILSLRKKIFSRELEFYYRVISLVDFDGTEKERIIGKIKQSELGYFRFSDNGFAICKNTLNGISKIIDKLNDEKTIIDLQ